MPSHCLCFQEGADHFVSGELLESVAAPGEEGEPWPCYSVWPLPQQHHSPLCTDQWGLRTPLQEGAAHLLKDYVHLIYKFLKFQHTHIKMVLIPKCISINIHWAFSFILTSSLNSCHFLPFLCTSPPSAFCHGWFIDRWQVGWTSGQNSLSVASTDNTVWAFFCRKETGCSLVASIKSGSQHGCTHAQRAWSNT